MRRVLLASLLSAAFADEDAVEAGDKVVDGFTEEQKKGMDEAGESHEFQAEVSRLMDIIINSLYTDKQVFIRELISNSADALEKVRFYSTSDENYLGKTKELEIKIEHDPEAKTLSIIDTGVGMSKTDLINNLGTVAKSGTTNFLEAMAEGGDANLIGQFGVGFYSAFLVADKVTVTSKSNDEDKQHVWESTADAKFTIVEDPRGDTLGRGTRITMHLKEDALDYLSEDKLKDSVAKYSQFIQFPIYVKVKKTAEADDFDDDKDDKDDDDEDNKDDDDKEEEKEKVKKVEFEWEQVNTEKAIWKRSKDEVTDEQYQSFYKAFSKDYLDPLAWTHFTAEGEVDFNSILFVPEKLSQEAANNYASSKSEIKLFVRRVLVAEQFDDLLPKYLNFVKGVVDSDDLPLNVSREQLQQNKIMKVISKKLVRKVLELIKNLAKEDEGDDDDDEDGEKKTEEKKAEGESKYELFWKEFGKHLKMGCYEDDSNRSKLAKLLRYHTTKSGEKEISLDKYVDSMPEKQDSIYYIAGDNKETLMNLPNLQIFKKKDIEVLLLTDAIDEPCMNKLNDFEGKKLVSVQKANLELEETEEEVSRFNRMKEVYKPLTEWWKSLLSKSKLPMIKDLNIERVALSKKLTTDPVLVVTSQFGYTPQQEKIWRAQTFSDKTQLAMMAGKKTLEINGNHPIIVDLAQKVKDNAEDPVAKEIGETLFAAGAMGSGFEIGDSASLASRVYRMISGSLKLDPDAEIKDIELPEEEEEEAAEEEAVEEEEKDAPAEEKEEL